ncbi:class E sortase [Crossiella cryophila]|uniref:Sortase (Surface protein transpeptidase) n=1 Tax=Crossiella cryophila TaxID=43355 RepID=A0A7W7FS31_9PSEU|nr:class E sortase [Crossiella cryophila]MBB4674993.1 sortase (surface protein transpeptidase) [Crossiella cryophila]
MTDPRTPQPEDGTEATQEIHHRQPRDQRPEQWWSEPGAEARPAPRRPEPPRAEVPPDAPRRAEPPRAELPPDAPRRAELPPEAPRRPEPPQVWVAPGDTPPGEGHQGAPRFQGEPPRSDQPRQPAEPPRPDLRAPGVPGQFEPPRFEPPQDPRGHSEAARFEPPRPPQEARMPGEGLNEPPRPPMRPRTEPPRAEPPRGARPSAPPPADAEQTQLIPPIRPDAPPPTPPRAVAPPPTPEELTMPIPRIPARPRLDEPETELIPRVEDYEDYSDLVAADPEPEPEAEAAAVPAQRREPGRVVVRTFGELLITAGLVVLLFVVYEVYVTDWLSAGKQANATTAMDDRWKNPSVVNNNEPQRTNQFQVGDGEGFAKVFVPAFGPDWVYTVLEGTTDKILEVGPGHYKGTAYPGQPGNFAVAGHRVGKGAPFNDIDLLESCDAIVVETQNEWFVYRMLPKSDEVKDWAAGKGKDAKCKGVAPQGKGGKDDPYAKTVGQEIVRPEQGEVIAPVPWRGNNAVPQGQQAKLITLTTCHPRFSARQRLIVHGVLVRSQPKDPKDPKAVPAEFQTG